jgi:hypothetical protein
MKRLLHSILLVALLATSVLLAAQARTYNVISVEVPFKFNVGTRTFSAGHYQFISVGPGLLAVRDSHARVIASLITRSIETGEVSPATKLVFELQKKHSKLARIRIQNRSQALEVLGEELAMRQPPAPLGPGLGLGPDGLSMFERRLPTPFSH